MAANGPAVAVRAPFPGDRRADDARPPLHRALRALRIDRKGVAAGIAVTIVLTGALVVFAQPIWRVQGRAVERLLSFAGVDVTVRAHPAASEASRGGGVWAEFSRGGPEFQLEAPYPRVSRSAAIVGIVALWILGTFVAAVHGIPLPLRVFGLFLWLLAATTLVYNAWVSPVPPHAIERLAVDARQSGIVVVVIGSALFSFSLFPLPAPLRHKLGWLLAFAAFALCWNVLRMAVVLATVSRVGGLSFLFLHYLAGPFVDFLYIVTFYSLGLYSVSGRLREARA